MNRYPLWKNLLVFGVVVVSTIIALAELLRRRRGRASLAHRRRCDRRARARAGADDADGRRRRVPVGRDRGHVGARACRRRSQIQERARDVLTKALPNNVVALSLSPRTPGWLKALGLEPMLLGLDLRGGVHFLYQVDLDTAVGQFLETYETDLRTQFREREIRNDMRVVGTTPAGRDHRAGRHGRAPRRSSASSTPAISCCSSASSRAGSSSTARRSTAGPASTCGSRSPRSASARTSRSSRTRVTLRNRVNELGVAEAVVQRQGLDRILVELPGIQDPATAKRVLGSTATLEFHLVDQDNDAFEAERRGRAPLGSELHHRRQDGSPILLRRDIIASGRSARRRQSELQQRPARRATCGSMPAGARKMLDTTLDNVGQHDGRAVHRRPAAAMVERDGEQVPGDPIRYGRGHQRRADQGRVLEPLRDQRALGVRGARSRAVAARRLARGADRADRGAHDRPELGPRQHRARHRRRC